MPIASVCILSWNNLDTLKENINRLRSEPNIEIIVFDQGSIDGTQDYLKKNRGISVIQSQTNVGNSIARNVMVRSCAGKYVIFLDGDVFVIRKSIQKLVKFLEDNASFDGIGYDNANFSTTEEIETQNDDIVIEDNFNGSASPVCFSQYGCYRKSVLDLCPFPEFYPFNQEGWGYEDTTVGLTMFRNGCRVAKILNSKYRHDINSSWKHMGEDQRRRTIYLRFAYYKYFEQILTPIQMLEALQNKQIPQTSFDLKAYFYKGIQNLGDSSFEYLINKHLPFVHFDEQSKNVAFLGGSVFNHTKYIENRMQANHYLFYGCGLALDSELTKYNVPYTIYARGPVTQKKLEDFGLKVEKVVGDTGFLAFLESAIPYKKDGKVAVVKDGFKDVSLDIKYDEEFAVANTNFTQQVQKKIVTFNQYVEYLKECKEVHSTQIHPAIFAVALGVPAKLYPKDYRYDDFMELLQGYWDLPECLTRASTLRVRYSIGNKTRDWINDFFEAIKPYKK